jgi:hypothetical protein
MTQHIENTPIPAPSEDGQKEEEIKDQEEELDLNSKEYIKKSQEVAGMKVR